MRVVTWNCQMAFRKKAEQILKFNPDILIVQECESLAKLDSLARKPVQSFWFGNNQHKGLAIFNFSNSALEIHKKYNDHYKWIIPLTVQGEAKFMLFAVWAMNNKNHKLSYIGQVYLALKEYQELLAKEQCLIAGDFNSNKAWDNIPRIGNHSAVVDLLKENNIFSTYHLYYHEEQGEETRYTLYEYRHLDKGYHIDYCFASKNLADKLLSVEVGDYNNWSNLSDHCPLIIDF